MLNDNQDIIHTETYTNRSMSMLCFMTLKRMQKNLISTYYVIIYYNKKHELLCGCQIDNRNYLNLQIYLMLSGGL